MSLHELTFAEVVVGEQSWMLQLHCQLDLGCLQEWLRSGKKPNPLPGNPGILDRNSATSETIQVNRSCQDQPCASDVLAVCHILMTSPEGWPATRPGSGPGRLADPDGPTCSV